MTRYPHYDSISAYSLDNKTDTRYQHAYSDTLQATLNGGAATEYHTAIGKYCPSHVFGQIFSDINALNPSFISL